MPGTFVNFRGVFGIRPKMCRAQADTNASRRTRKNKPPAPVVQSVDNAVHWVNHYPLDSAIVCPDTYIPREDKGDREGIPHTHPVPQVIRLELFLESR